MGGWIGEYAKGINFQLYFIPSNIIILSFIDSLALAMKDKKDGKKWSTL